MKQFRNINGPSGVLVSLGKGQVKEMCLEMFPENEKQCINYLTVSYQRSSCFIYCVPYDVTFVLFLLNFEHCDY